MIPHSLSLSLWAHHVPQSPRSFKRRLASLSWPCGVSLYSYKDTHVPSGTRMCSLSVFSSASQSLSACSRALSPLSLSRASTPTCALSLASALAQRLLTLFASALLLQYYWKCIKIFFVLSTDNVLFITRIQARSWGSNCWLTVWHIDVITIIFVLLDRKQNVISRRYRNSLYEYIDMIQY